MSLPGSVAAAIGSQLGQPLRHTARVTGGDINDCFAGQLADGTRVFIKTHQAAPAGMYRAEADGLRWLQVPAGPRIPRVLAVGETGGPAFLVLEHIERGRPARDHDERLGHSLAALHQAGTERFGFATDNFIATLPQANRATDSWPRFYAEQRLAPLLRRAHDAGQAPVAMHQAVSTVIARIDQLVGPPEPPARLHGDLWSGNAITDEHGAPVLIDPAVYAGHREVDLAMMQLFGGFSPRVFAAYQEAHPLAAGAAQRVALYQLYPLLVHVCLFGGHYVQSAERAARAALGG